MTEPTISQGSSRNARVLERLEPDAIEQVLVESFRAAAGERPVAFGALMLNTVVGPGTELFYAYRQASAAGRPAIEAGIARALHRLAAPPVSFYGLRQLARAAAHTREAGGPYTSDLPLALERVALRVADAGDASKDTERAISALLRALQTLIGYSDAAAGLERCFASPSLRPSQTRQVALALTKASPHCWDQYVGGLLPALTSLPPHRATLFARSVVRSVGLGLLVRGLGRLDGEQREAFFQVFVDRDASPLQINDPISPRYLTLRPTPDLPTHSHRLKAEIPLYILPDALAFYERRLMPSADEATLSPTAALEDAALQALRMAETLSKDPELFAQA